MVFNNYFLTIKSLKFVNKQKLEVQKKVFKYLLSQIGSNLISGKSILSISLPVYIFERRSNLERFAFSFAYAPSFFEPVAQSTPIEQIKSTSIFALTQIFLYLNLEKPFNPILGETYQGWIKGCPVYLEQVSHHPPIASFYFLGRGYKQIFQILIFIPDFTAITNQWLQWGQILYQAKMKDTFKLSLIILVVRSSLVYAQVQFSLIELFFLGSVSGITIGDRIFYAEGQCWGIDFVNKNLVDFYVNPPSGFFGKKNMMDAISGNIFKIDDNEVKRWKKDGFQKYTGLRNQTHTYETVGQISGKQWDCIIYMNHLNSLNKSILIDGKEMFNINSHYPNILENDASPLASDGKYREDLIAWKLNDFDLAMEKKVEIDKLYQFKSLNQKTSKELTES